MVSNPQVKCDVVTCKFNAEAQACNASSIAVNGKAAAAPKNTECATFSRK